MGKNISPGVAVVVIIIVVLVVLVVGYFAFLRPKAGGSGPSPEEVDAMMEQGQPAAVEQAGDQRVRLARFDQLLCLAVIRWPSE